MPRKGIGLILNNFRPCLEVEWRLAPSSLLVSHLFQRQHTVSALGRAVSGRVSSAWRRISTHNQSSILCALSLLLLQLRDLVDSNPGYFAAKGRIICVYFIPSHYLCMEAGRTLSVSFWEDHFKSVTLIWCWWGRLSRIHTRGSLVKPSRPPTFPGGPRPPSCPLRRQ